MIQIFLDCLHLDRKRFPLDVLFALDDAQWKELIRLAAGHRVTAVFHNRIAAALSETGHAGESAKTAGPSDVITSPESAESGTDVSTKGTSSILPGPFRRAMEELHGYTTRLTRENLRKQADLQAILRRFREDGIPVILLKGAYLATEVYPGMGMREMVDVDLMVRVPDLQRAAEAVMGLGYRPHRSLRDMATEIRNKHHLPIMQRAGAIQVELHWNVTHEGRADFAPPDGFWERSREIRVAGEPARAMACEDMLLHLCLHLSHQHMFTVGIRALYDVALLVSRSGDGPDWGVFVERARALGWHRGAWLTLQLARDMLGADVPVPALTRLRVDEGAQEMLRVAREEVLALLYTKHVLSTQMAVMAQNKGTGKQIRHLFSRIFLPREQMALLYDLRPDSPMLALYYPVRFCDLLRRQTRFTLDMIRGDERVMGHVRRKNLLRHWLGKRL